MEKFSKNEKVAIAMFSLTSWLLLTVVVSVYCYLHNIFSEGAYTPWFDSLLWSAKAWLVWLVITPFMFKKTHIENLNLDDLKKYVRRWMVLAGVLIFAAILVKMVFDWFLGKPFGANAYAYLSTEPVVFLVMLFSSHVVKFHLSVYRISESESIKGKHKDRQEDKQSLLLVSRGNTQVFLKKDNISWLKACGNYVEIHDENEQYLLRTTLKEMDAQLNNESFIRIHRSYIVNKNHVKAVVQDKGVSNVELIMGVQLPLGKTYKKHQKDLIPVL